MTSPASLSPRQQHSADLDVDNVDNVDPKSKPTIPKDPQSSWGLCETPKKGGTNPTIGGRPPRSAMKIIGSFCNSKHPHSGKQSGVDHLRGEKRRFLLHGYQHMGRYKCSNGKIWKITRIIRKLMLLIQLN